jgi:hypothetical protein
MVHAARASAARATAPSSTRHFLIAGQKILKTELTPSVSTPNAFLIAGICPTFFAHALRPALLIGTPIRLEFDLTPSAPIQNAFLIGTIGPILTPARLFTRHSSLITSHHLTPFLFDTNKPHKIIILVIILMKTKEKQFSIRYKLASHDISLPAAGSQSRPGPKAESAPHLPRPRNAPCLGLQVVLSCPAASGPNWFAWLGTGA